MLRIKVKPGSNEYTERLQYFIQDNGKGKAVISLKWEKLKVSFDLLLKS